MHIYSHLCCSPLPLHKALGTALLSRPEYSYVVLIAITQRRGAPADERAPSRVANALAEQPASTMAQAAAEVKPRRKNNGWDEVERAGLMQLVLEAERLNGVSLGVLLLRSAPQ